MDTISNQPVSQETVTPLESAPPSFRLTPALFGGLGAGIVGGVLWGLIVSWTGYELGYAAWGLGLLVGFTVVFTAKGARSEEHTSELQSQSNLVCRLLLEKI